MNEDSLRNKTEQLQTVPHSTQFPHGFPSSWQFECTSSSIYIHSINKTSSVRTT